MGKRREKAVVSIKGSRDQQIGLVLRKLKSEIAFSNEGREYRYRSRFRFNVAIEVVHGAVSIDISRGELCPEALIESRDLVRKAIIETLRQESTDPTAFLQNLQRMVDRALSAPLKQFTFMSCSNLEIPLPPRGTTMTVGGTRFNVTAPRKLKRRFPKVEREIKRRFAFGKNTPSLVPMRPFPPWVMQCSLFVGKAMGPDASTAGERFIEDLHLLRSAINLVWSFGQTSIQFGAPQYLAIFPPPPFQCLIDDSGEPFFQAVPLNLSWPPLKELSLDTLAGARNLLRRLRRDTRKHEIMKLFELVIREYGEALDTTDWPDAFLCLWRALERLTLVSSTTEPMSQVARRASALLSRDPMFAALPQCLCDTRNRYVHEHEFPRDQLRQVSLLKTVVEACLNNSIRLSERPSMDRMADLRTFYDHIGKGDMELARERRICKEIMDGWRSQGKRKVNP